MSTKPTLLVLSQVYVPDPASVGQHMADAAAEMAERGFDVRVITSGRGYDDPSIKYASRETIEGVDVRRVPLSSFGKKSIPLRLLAGVLFMVQSVLRGLFTPRLKGILVSTSPPMCSIAAVIIGTLRGVPIKYWVMDLNPDQMVQLGKAKPTSFGVRCFDMFNRIILRKASDIVALDRFMAERVNRKVDVSAKMAVMPPWPHEDALEVVAHEENPFRKEHGLDGKFVIMYSGNHGVSNPVKTVLDAALKLQDEKDLVFMFIGGGVGKKEVEDTIERYSPPNIRSLPYQPLDRIKYSLSAADVHLVSIGETLVGVVHPCKVYGSMAVARPVLLLGPDPCHVSDLVANHNIGWHIQHGDVDGAIEVIREMLATSREDMVAMGERARQVVVKDLSKDALCEAFCDVVQRGLVPEGQLQMADSA